MAGISKAERERRAQAARKAEAALIKKDQEVAKFMLPEAAVEFVKLIADAPEARLADDVGIYREIVKHGMLMLAFRPGKTSEFIRFLATVPETRLKADLETYRAAVDLGVPLHVGPSVGKYSMNPNGNEGFAEPPKRRGFVKWLFG